jgi:hypothetical protein
MSKFISGEWKALCDSCGVEFKASQLRKRWDGFMVCDADWETRHIADFIKAPKPETPLPWTRPDDHDVESAAPTYISQSTGTQEHTIPTAPTGNRGTL